MTVGEVTAHFLREAATAARCVLLEDPHGLVRLPAELRTRAELEPLTVLHGVGNLSFRAALARLQRRPHRLLVVRQRPELFLPDVEALAAADGLRLVVTPRWVLQQATGDASWPAWVDGEAELVGTVLSAVVTQHRRFRHISDEPLDDADAERVLLSGLLGLDLEEAVDPADAWLACARCEEALARLQERGSRLAARYRGWLRRQRAPVSWLAHGEPAAAARLTWLVALLLPHFPDLGSWLARAYPGARLVEGEDLTAVARVAYRLERQAPQLALTQRLAAESVLAGPLRESVLRLLNLRTVEGAAALLRREERSGFLVLVALRTLLGALAADHPPDELGLEPVLGALEPRLERLTHADAVRLHRDLLSSLLALDSIRRRLASSPAMTPARARTAYLEAEADTLITEVGRASACLCDNALAETGWDADPDPERHKAVVAALFHAVKLAEQAGAALDETASSDEAEPLEPEPLEPEPVANAWDRLFEPLLRQHGDPRVSLIVVGGLNWCHWRQDVSRRLSRHYEIDVRPTLAPVPAASGWALRRAVGGPAWQPEWAALPWAELVTVARPGWAGRRGRPPQALAPLAEAGLLLYHRTSQDRQLVLVDLLAGAAGGLLPDRYSERVRLLAEAIAALARSGRRDELVVLWSVSGAALCEPAAGLALPGTSFGARALLTAPEADLPASSRRLVPASLGIPAAEDELLLIAADRRRLVPCAAGQVFADGGASLAERIVPLALLTPLAGLDAPVFDVSPLVAPRQATAGEPFEVGLHVTLLGGALAEQATMVLLEPPGEAVTATLDCGETRWLGLTVQPGHARPSDAADPSGLAPSVVPVEVLLTCGRRRWRRCAVVELPDGLQNESRRSR